MYHVERIFYIYTYTYKHTHTHTKLQLLGSIYNKCLQYLIHFQGTVPSSTSVQKWPKKFNYGSFFFFFPVITDYDESRIENKNVRCYVFFFLIRTREIWNGSDAQEIEKCGCRSRLTIRINQTVEVTHTNWGK